MDNSSYEIDSKTLTNEEKCKLWLDIGLIQEQEHEILKAIMDEHNPHTAKENKLVFLKFLYEVGEITQEHYHQAVTNINKQG